jgi:hypothetical protein
MKKHKGSSVPYSQRLAEQKYHHDNVTYLKGARDGIKTSNVLWLLALWNVYDSCQNRIYKPQLVELLSLALPEHRRLKDSLGEEDDLAERVTYYAEKICAELGFKMEDLG